MEIPKLDGTVKPGEYNQRVDSADFPAQAYPADGGIHVAFYYSYDGQSFQFGFQKLEPCATLAAQIRLDPDRNGAEVGDLTLTVVPQDVLHTYGVYEGLTEARAVCGSPPDPRRAGVSVACDRNGDTEVWLDVAVQHQNGMDPNPLEATMAIHLAIQVDVVGRVVTNFVNAVVPTRTDATMDFDFG